MIRAIEIQKTEKKAHFIIDHYKVDLKDDGVKHGSSGNEEIHR